MMTFEIMNPKTHQRLKVGGVDFESVTRTVKIVCDVLDSNEVRYRVDRSNNTPTIWLHINKKLWVELFPCDVKAKEFVRDALMLVDKPIDKDIKF